MDRKLFVKKTKEGIEKKRKAGYLTHRPLVFGEAFRQEAVELHEMGMGVRAIAIELGCSIGTAVALCKCDPIEEKEYKRKIKKGKLSTIDAERIAS